MKPNRYTQLEAVLYSGKALSLTFRAGWGGENMTRGTPFPEEGRAVRQGTWSAQPDTYCSLLEGWQRMGVRVSEGEGDHLKARGSKQGEELSRKKALMLPASARLPGWSGRWRQLPLLQGLADLVVQS